MRLCFHLTTINVIKEWLNIFNISAITQSLQELLAAADAYPDLNARQNLLALQYSLIDIERRKKRQKKGSVTNAAYLR